jgi:hypothetical protein
MAVRPGNELGAASRGRLRASHADREQVIGTLKAAFVHGRVTKDEFDARVGAVLASRTYAELAVVTADLPAGPTAAQPQASAQGKGWLTVERAVTWTACMVFPAATATVMGWVVAGRIEAGPVILLSVLAFFVATVVGGVMISEAWDKNKRHRGQLPTGPDPDAGGQESRGPGSGVGNGQLPQVDHGAPRTAEAVRKRSARLTIARRPAAAVNGALAEAAMCSAAPRTDPSGTRIQAEATWPG